MPVLAEAALYPTLGEVLFAGGATWGATVAAVEIASYAITFSAYYAYGTYQARSARRAAKDAFNASLQDRLVMGATTDGPRSRCYGRVRNVDGILFKSSHGADKRYYTFVISVAGHEIDGFEDFYFADQKLTLDGSGYVQTEPYALTMNETRSADTTSQAESGSFTITLGGGETLIPGSVGVTFSNGAIDQNGSHALGAFTVAGNVVSWTGNADHLEVWVTYQVTMPISKARIRTYTGSPTQDLSSTLIALGVENVTSEHQFRGMACMLVTLEFDVDAYPQGVPPMSAVFRGAKCYDPVTGLTAWTDNPAIIARDWALYSQGGGATQADLYDDFIGSQSACDVMHTFHSAAYGDVARRMYTCNIVIPTDADPTDALNEIVAAMAGKYAWVGGRLRVTAGYYRAPVATLDEWWLTDKASIDIQSGVARVDLVNVYKPTIADYRHDYVVTPTAPVPAPAYIALDGAEYSRDVKFVGITDFEHAQHVAGVLLRDARQGLTVKLPCNMKAYPIEVFDVIAITLPRFGWDQKAFEVLAWELDPNTGGVTLTAKETDASIWDPDAGFTAIDQSPNTTLPQPWFVPIPSGLAVTSTAAHLQDGSVVTRCEVTWDAFSDASVQQSGTLEIQYIPFIDVPDDRTVQWPNVTARAGAQSTVIVGLQGGMVYLFRARAINSIGVRSPWSVMVPHLVAYPPSISVDWTNIPGVPLLFRVVARGLDDTAMSGIAGLYNGDTGVQLEGSVRSYMMVRIARATGAISFFQTYDVFGNGALTAGRNAATLAADLNATGLDSIVIVWTYDEPKARRFDSNLALAMYRCGASRPVFGDPSRVDVWLARSAYVLIGIGGCGEGNGFEAFKDSSTPTSTFVDVAWMLKGGNLIVTGASTQPGTLRDFGYEGTLDATTDLYLIARGNCVLAGNYAEKLGGVASWDSDVYSRDSFRGGAFCSCRPAQTGKDVMFGLNADPTSDQSYTSLDYALYFRGDGQVEIYEDGVSHGIQGTYATDEVYSITYDGVNVIYWRSKAGVPEVLGTPRPAAAGKALFFDSSFASPGAALALIRFGPLSAVTGIDTNQIALNAVTSQQFVTLLSDVVAPQNTAENILITLSSVDPKGQPLKIDFDLDTKTAGIGGPTYTIRIRVNGVQVWSTLWQMLGTGGATSSEQMLSGTIGVPGLSGAQVITVTVQCSTTTTDDFRFKTASLNSAGTSMSAVAYKR